ncbi:MAG: HEPN domain-containing protein [Acidobacteriota bacterium]
MKPITKEWIAKAEGDWASALREVRARKQPNYDAACFHAQQCAEKYLKARLQEASTPSGKTHDLVKLLDLVLPIDPACGMLRADLAVLTNYAVDYRYPGKTATKPEAQDAIKRCRLVRTVIRRTLGLNP